MDCCRRVQHHDTASSPQQGGRQCRLGDVGRGLKRENAAEHRDKSTNVRFGFVGAPLFYLPLVPHVWQVKAQEAGCMRLCMAVQVSIFVTVNRRRRRARRTLRENRALP